MQYQDTTITDSQKTTTDILIVDLHRSGLVTDKALIAYALARIGIQHDEVQRLIDSTGTTSGTTRDITRKRWTADEDNVLVTEYGNGMKTAGELAILFGRTEPAVRQRLAILGVRHAWSKSKAGNQQ